jgi:hypothetical protein
MRSGSRIEPLVGTRRDAGAAMSKRALRRKHNVRYRMADGTSLLTIVWCPRVGVHEECGASVLRMHIGRSAVQDARCLALRVRNSWWPKRQRAFANRGGDR